MPTSPALARDLPRADTETARQNSLRPALNHYPERGRRSPIMHPSWPSEQASRAARDGLLTDEGVDHILGVCHRQPVALELDT